MGPNTSIIHEGRQRAFIGRLTALSAVNVDGAQKRSCLCPAFAVLATEKVQQLVDLLAARQVFGEEIRWVDLAPYLADLDRSRPHFLLDPQSVSLEMAELAET